MEAALDIPVLFAWAKSTNFRSTSVPMSWNQAPARLLSIILGTIPASESPDGSIGVIDPNLLRESQTFNNFFLTSSILT